MADEAVVTTEIVEVLLTASPAAVVTTEIVEVALTPSPMAVVTTEVVEVLFPVENPGGDARITQVSQEVVLYAQVPAYVTQSNAEVVIGTFVPGRLTQESIEVLVDNLDGFVPQIYRVKRP